MLDDKISAIFFCFSDFFPKIFLGAYPFISYPQKWSKKYFGKFYSFFFFLVIFHILSYQADTKQTPPYVSQRSQMSCMGCQCALRVKAHGDVYFVPAIEGKPGGAARVWQKLSVQGKCHCFSGMTRRAAPPGRNQKSAKNMWFLHFL